MSYDAASAESTATSAEDAAAYQPQPSPKCCAGHAGAVNRQERRKADRTCPLNRRLLFTHSTVPEALLIVEDYDMQAGVRWQDRLTEWLDRLHR